MMQAIGFNFSQGLDYPLLFDLNELIDSMLGNSGWSDNFDFTERYDDAHLRGPQAASNLVGKC